MVVPQTPPSTSATTTSLEDSSTAKTKELSSSTSGRASTSTDMSPTNTNVKPSLSTSDTEADADTFIGEDLDQNNVIPSIADIQALDDYQVFDREGKARSFRSLYTGPHVAKRILLIFVRHFFCGNCQEYLRTLTLTLSPPTLLSLPHPTFIAIIGCGQPSLIPMYASTTNCPYPIYADPTKGLYRALNMGRTLDLGKRPEYQRRSLVKGMLQSIGQGLKQFRGGQVFKGGDYQQVGGEFLFEPISWDGVSPGWEVQRQLGEGDKENEDRRHGDENVANADSSDGAPTKTPPPKRNTLQPENVGEPKHITWCHRMRNTRDHAEIPELLEVLGVDIGGEDVVRGKDARRWSKALVERKGTGFSTGNVSLSGGMSLGKGSLRSRASSEKLMGTPEVDEKGAGAAST